MIKKGKKSKQFSYIFLEIIFFSIKDTLAHTNTHTVQS